MARRLFTLRDAERALPLIRAHLLDGLHAKERLEEIRAEIERLDDEAGIDDDFQVRLFALLKEHHQLSARLFDLLESLERLGVVIKNFDTGLVDFPCRFEDRDIYLCWQLGERRIQHWHVLQEGFAGRKPIVDVEFELQKP